MTPETFLIEYLQSLEFVIRHCATYKCAYKFKTSEGDLITCWTLNKNRSSLKRDQHLLDILFVGAIKMRDTAFISC